MPRKTKELNEENESKKTNSNITNTPKNQNSKVSKEKSTNKVTKTKSVTKTSSKKSSAKKTSSNKTTKAKDSKTKSNKSKKTSKKPVFVNTEYYDLPYRYNQTVVKVLAQTPTNLFIYWDISDEDKENFKKQYGSNFFETTYPVLIVYNDTLHYHFEVAINDFANSWYLHVNDSKSDYRIELGRKPIDYHKFNEDIKNISENISSNVDYIQISTSNKIESPNDRILFNKEQKMIYFRNVKNNETLSKPITSLSFMQNMGKIYDIYELYQKIYKDEIVEDFYDLSNTSSSHS